ncbi:hypothetical protein M1555_00405 [Patescibacteria group bacterium]|nr:hypothetical protein [Patescibacteria group bacterium]
MERLRKLFGHTLIKNSSIVFIGSIFANFGAWLYHLAVGRILGPAKYSELAALFALFYILSVPSGVLQTIMVKFFSVLKARNANGEAKQLLLRSVRLIFLLECAGLVIALPLIPLVAGYLHMRSRVYFIWLYLIFAVSTISIINSAAIRAFQFFTASSIIGNISIFLRLFIAIPAAFFGVGWTLVGNVVSSVLSYLTTFIPLRFLFRAKQERLSLTKHEAFHYSWPVLLTTFGITLIYSQDILLVKHYFPSREAGIYSALSVLGKAVFYASSAVEFVIFPLVAERTELKASHGKVVWLGLLAVGFVSSAITVLYFLIPGIVVLPFGPAFRPAAPYLGLFGIFISFYTLANLLNSIQLAAGNTFIWILTVGSAVAQAVCISLFHQTLYEVVYVDIAVGAALFLSLLMSYTYAKIKA